MHLTRLFTAFVKCILCFRNYLLAEYVFFSFDRSSSAGGNNVFGFELDYFKLCVFIIFHFCSPFSQNQRFE